jgi:integrase
MASIQDKTEEGRGFVVRWRDPSGKQRSKTCKTEREAKRERSRIENEMNVGDYVDPAGSKVHFGVQWDRYWAMTAGSVRASTGDRNASYYRSMIEPEFGSVPLGSIDYLTIQTWIHRLQVEEGKAPATVHKAHQLLSKVLGSAVKGRLIRSNPCSETELPKIEVNEQRFLDHEEVAVLAETIDPRYRSLVITAAYSGLRIGELIALKRSGVDVRKARISVAWTCVEVKGGLAENPPKTKAGRRSVPVPRFVLEALEEQIKGLEPGELVFRSPQGDQIRARQFRKRFWSPAIEAAGLAPLRIHDLRHTAVSFWIDAGANPKEIARRAGHASVVTVLDRYGHLLPSDDDHVTDALDARARAAVTKSVERIATVTPIRKRVAS